MKNSDSGFAGQFVRILLLGVAFVLATQSPQTQVLYGSLIGKVEDPSRAVLPGATVTVTNRDTGLQRETTTDGSGSYAFQGLSQGVIELPRAVGTQTFPEVFKRGYIQSFNLTVQHDIGAGVIGQAAYVGSRAIRQTANVNINASGPGGGNNGRALFPQFGRIANINMLTPFNTATYDSLQTQLTRRLSANSMLGVSLHVFQGD